MRHTVRRGACLLLVLASALPLRAQIIEQVLVKVNGDIITKTELEKRQIDAVRQRLNKDIDPVH